MDLSDFNSIPLDGNPGRPILLGLREPVDSRPKGEC